jgi:hypothetical protein
LTFFIPSKDGGNYPAFLGAGIYAELIELADLQKRLRMGDL